jgi:hypothetical protein
MSLIAQEVVDIAVPPSYDLRLMAIAELLASVLGANSPSRCGPTTAAVWGRPTHWLRIVLRNPNALVA